VTDIPVRLDVRVTSAALVVNEKKRLRAAVRGAGAELMGVARKKIGASGSGRVYRGPGGSAKYRGGYTRGKFQASSPGSAPAKATGFLRRSMKVYVFKSGEGVAVRARAFYALFLEKGAKGGGRHGSPGKKVRGARGIGKQRVLEARPFLTAALDDRGASIGQRLHDAIEQDIKFVRVRP
jgi:hypothetical protein